MPIFKPIRENQNDDFKKLVREAFMELISEVSIEDIMNHEKEVIDKTAKPNVVLKGIDREFEKEFFTNYIEANRDRFNSVFENIIGDRKGYKVALEYVSNYPINLQMVNWIKDRPKADSDDVKEIFEQLEEAARSLSEELDIPYESIFCHGDIDGEGTYALAMIIRPEGREDESNE